MKVSNNLRKSFRFPLNYLNRKKLRNDDFSIISSNCVGGVIYHELGKKFLSPTINLWFEPRDFLKFAHNLKFYLTQELVCVESDYNYPVGLLYDIKIYFMHYHSFDEAKSKWGTRCNRINHNNIYILMTQSKEADDEIVREFNTLPYAHKAILTEKEFKNIKCAYQIPMVRKNNQIYDLCMFKSKFTGLRWLDDFDYVTFLNKK